MKKAPVKNVVKNCDEAWEVTGDGDFSRRVEVNLKVAFDAAEVGATGRRRWKTVHYIGSRAFHTRTDTKALVVTSPLE